MASMTFLINDSASTGTPLAQITITENGDGTVAMSLTQLPGLVGDLRGLFFDLADAAVIGSLAAVGVGATDFRQGNNSIVDMGGGANVSGLLGQGLGYDAGLEIGTSGVRTGDDFRTFAFTLASSSRALTIADFSNVNFAVRTTSVGMDANLDGVFETARGGSAKTGETTFTVISPQADLAAVMEDASATGNVLANDGAGTGDVLSVVNWTGGTLGAAHAFARLAGATVRLNGDGSYAVDASAADTLAAGESVSQTFSYDVLQDNADGSAIRTVGFTVTITGTNDAPVIEAGAAGLDAAGAVAEKAEPGEGGTLSDAGTLFFSDVDASDTHAASVSATVLDGAGNPVAAPLGSFSLGAVDQAGHSVGWNFSVADAALDSLAAGETRVQRYAVTIGDGQGGTASQEVSVTITGTNDAPVIGGQLSGSVTEDSITSVSGTATVSDADNGESSFQAGSGLTGSFGTLNVNSTGNWTYFLNNSHAAVQALNAGSTLTDQILIRTADGTEQAIGITIHGANEARYVDFDTKPIQYSWYFSQNWGRSFIQTEFVGPQVEFTATETWGSYGQAYSVDLANDVITVDYANLYLSWVTASFNGFYLTDSQNRLPVFSGVQIISNNTAMTASRISVTPNEIAVNWNGLSFGPDSIFQFKILTNAANADPIVLDLDRNGFAFDRSASFDLNADGEREVTAWLDAGDGVLAIDLDRSGTVDSGAELLSEYFDARGFGDAMDALRALDGNLDGVVDARDAQFADLRVWRDVNGDGRTDQGELITLADLQIVAIHVAGDPSSDSVNGQQVYATGMFEYASGDVGEYAAVRFAPVSAEEPPPAQESVSVVGASGAETVTALG